MSRTSSFVLFLSLSLAACGSTAAPPPAKPAQPAPIAASPSPSSPGSTGARLVAEIDAWEKTVVIREAAPGHGLGGAELLVEGTPIWPPQGPGCAALVACCEGFAGDGDAPRALQLACQLSVAKGPDCPRALDTVETIAHEAGGALPSSCPAGG
jgi:hypothetical protein